ncbi:IclR family transcriptional regulator [Nocardioides dubius]|uniref:IclR family transcriptional regulator n=1 Tax=Nocardioides dubius TaxID=317019 RepID=A0ABN1TVF7_9ACTN
MPATQRAEDAPTAVLGRVGVLLDAFNGASSLTLAEITRRSGLPRSSSHRLLEQLVQLGWVSRVGNHYALGMRICELGTLVLHHNAVRRSATPYLQELHRVSGLAVHLGLLDGEDVIYLDRVGGASSFRLPTRIGGRFPAHASAIGKMLLASSGLSGVPERLRPVTTHTITRPAALMRALDRIRAERFSVESSEGVLGISCVAVAVSSPDGTPTALSVAGPTDTIRPERLVPMLRATAQRISHQLDQPRAAR